METKNSSSKIIINENNVLDLQALKKMVKIYIDRYYGKKLKANRMVRNKYGYSYQDAPVKTTLTTVFNLFKQRFIDNNKNFKKVFRHLNQNYSSTHKLRDLYIFKLKMEGYTFAQIADITGLSVVRVKQVYYKIKKLVGKK